MSEFEVKNNKINGCVHSVRGLGAALELLQVLRIREPGNLSPDHTTS